MYNSKSIRDIILIKNGLFEKSIPYFWDDDFIEQFSLINIDSCNLLKNNSNAKNLQDIYRLGLNYGSCGLTCRYLLQLFDKYEKGQALLHYGNCYILKGTKNSPNGKHAFIEYNKHIYCPTLMIKFPIEMKSQFGFITNKIIDIGSSRIISEYAKF